jgi:polysaccharide biosynthesis protein PslF
MRILFLTGEYPTMQGGVGDYTQRLSQALGELGADVHVLTHIEAGGDHLRQPAAAYEPTVYPTLRRAGFGLWRHVERAIRDLRPGVVHIQYQSAAYGLHPAVNYLPSRLRMARSRPHVVTTFHDLLFPYIFPKAGGLRWRAVLDLAKGSDASVLTNPADYERLQHACPDCRLSPIPIGSNIRCEPPADYDRAAQRGLLGAGEEAWLLAYFGFLNANKGGETLVRCLAELVKAGRPAQLLMVGGQVGSSDHTNEAYLAKVKALMAELGLSERVHWTGFVGSDQVSANLLAADCAVLPYKEGASLRHGSLMAALAHGLPVVSTAVPGQAPTGSYVFPRLIDTENALLVRPEDPLALAQAVTRVLTTTPLRARLSAAALMLSRQFDWDTIAQRHLELYGELR